MFKAFLFGAAAMAACGFYFVAYPLATAEKMRNAIAGKDGKTLVSLIDFESLRSDLEADLMASMSHEASDPMAMAFGGPIVSGAISGLIQPGIVEGMVEGSGGRFSPTRNGAPPAIGNASFRPGITTFTVSLTINEEPVSVVLAPRGLGWKVVGVDFDMKKFKP